MKLLSGTVIGLFLSAGAGTALAARPSAPVVVMASDLHWVAQTGPGKGTSLAVMTGNPNTSGTSVERVKLPAGFVNKPHYHAHPEYITVVSGALLFGTGDVVDKAKAKTVPTGSFIMVPAGVHH